MYSQTRIEVPEELLTKAKAGDAQSQFEVGKLYDPPNDSGSKENCAIALDWYEKAAAQNYPQAAEFSAYLILNGLVGEIDHERAMKWLRQAAEAGQPWACALAGGSYLQGQGVPKDGRQALTWFIKGAELGGPECMFRAGYILFKGIDVPRDIPAAVQWFEKGAEAGSSPARACLGILAWSGVGLPQDYAIAKTWFESAIAAKGGNTWAPFVLGVMYENGQGVPRDPAKAVEYYLRASKGGYYQAQIRCNQLRADVALIEVDLANLKRGAEVGNPLNQYVLGLAYLDGVNIEQNDVEALIWLDLSTEYHLTVAQEKAAELRAKLAPEALQTVARRQKEIREKIAQTGAMFF